jgi:hypothetical protein
MITGVLRTGSGIGQFLMESGYDCYLDGTLRLRMSDSRYLIQYGILLY